MANLRKKKTFSTTTTKKKQKQQQKLEEKQNQSCLKGPFLVDFEKNIYIFVFFGIITFKKGVSNSHLNRAITYIGILLYMRNNNFSSIISAQNQRVVSKYELLTMFYSILVSALFFFSLFFFNCKIRQKKRIRNARGLMQV